MNSCFKTGNREIPFKLRAEQYVNAINGAISGYMGKRPDTYRNVADAAVYSLMAGGKRIRGMLILEFCRIFSGDEDMALPFACAMEMMHCSSLIQDDMPCMDDDDYRRGKLSCHKKYGEDIALLASDTLMIMPFEIIASSGLEKEKIIAAVLTLAKSSGISGMVGGQAIDINYKNRGIAYDILKEMHNLKTGALIKASCELGAIAGGACASDIEKCGEFGSALGLAFQIKDDILDVTGDETFLGKPTGSDNKNNKTNYITVFGLQESERLAAEATEKAKKVLSGFNNNEFLNNLTDMLLNRNN